ncbi:MAG: hypothetical protein GX190_02745 [Mollicutes bacterium]|nr:hypothetical protein [Mollicutes bacterium]
MGDKELIEKWKKLKEIIEKSQKENKNANEDKTEEINTETKQTYGGRVKTIGTHPNTGSFFKGIRESENQKGGFTSALLLGFLTMFFQLLFIAIIYIIIS